MESEIFKFFDEAELSHHEQTVSIPAMIYSLIIILCGMVGLFIGCAYWIGWLP